MTVGWDFTYKDGIRDRNTGIWKSIRLYSTGNIQLRNPFVTSQLAHPNYDKAAATISVDVFNPNTQTFEGIVRGKILGTDIKLEKKVQMMRGEHKTITFTPEEFPQ